MAFGQQQGMSFNFFGGGARAEGMGNAFLAVANDGTAGTWNPAGLYVHERTLMTFSYGFFAPRGELKFQQGEPFAATYDHTGLYGSLGFWNIITPLRIKGQHVVANISYNRDFNVYYEFAENLYGNSSGLFIREDWAGNEVNALSQREGGISNVSFSLGTRIYKELSFGISANIYTGKVVSEEHRYFFRYGTADLGQIAPYENWITILDSVSYSGFNSTLGFLYAADKLRAGLVLRTPFNLKGKSDSTIIRTTTSKGLERSETFYDVRINGVDTVVYDITFGNLVEYPYPKTTKIQIPLIVGLGLAYNVKENWLVATDLEFKKFSGLKIYSLESFSYNSSSNLTEVFADNVNIPNWSNVFQFRLGTEYTFNTPIGQIPARIGFRTEAFPQGSISSYQITDTTSKTYSNGTNVDTAVVENPDPGYVAYAFEYNTDQVKGFTISLGTGIYWSQILIDVAYSFTEYKQDIYKYENEPRYKSTNEWKNHNVSLTFTGYF
jgi:hypothetical protein